MTAGQNGAVWRTGSGPELEPEPEDVGVLLEAAGAEEERIVELAMKPERVDLEELVPVPIHAEFGGDGRARPQVRVGDSSG
jgi:hypothetical protein